MRSEDEKRKNGEKKRMRRMMALLTKCNESLTRALLKFGGQ
jgi:hypothetical protein